MTTKISLALFLVGFLWTGFAVAQVEGPSSKGTVTAARSWNLAALVDGRIKSLNFIEGQLVSKGDLLVELDDVLVQLEFSLAKFNMQRAETVLKQREEELGRQEKLKRREVASVASYHDAKYNVELAKTELQVADLKVQVVQAVLAAHKIHAPAAGLISAPRLMVGSNFSVAESGSIATIVQLDPINVRADISVERVLARLQAGTYTMESTRDLKIGISLSNGIEYPLHGKIVSLGFDLDPETGVGSILVEFPNPKGGLRPGLPVVVRLQQD
ncbi:MAG: efflux RND transporter periplasmic adaptor subunit [Tateyamaria sp.]|uniref:efflux RND transporter periplasmic adaptor subunit n=1 Tax=Tateyamaria sp. TaxID=1929288 RepID=UPI00329C309A